MIICNGSKQHKDKITFGHNYANSICSESEQLFWALTVHLGLSAFGADVSNIFSEAPAPDLPICLYIDDAYHEWWRIHELSHEPIPGHYNVIHVYHAIQGHPEASHLWEKHINKILKCISLQPTKHEPCLYRSLFQGTDISSYDKWMTLQWHLPTQTVSTNSSWKLI